MIYKNISNKYTNASRKAKLDHFIKFKFISIVLNYLEVIFKLYL